MTRAHDTATTWRAHVDERLDEIRAGMLDLIDVGVPDAPAQERPPTRRERIATDRADGKFEPTPTGPTSRAGGTHGDPTTTAVLVWEGQVQTATTSLYATVAAAQEVADGLGLTPLDEHGRELAAPPEPPTRVTLSGRRVVDIAPRHYDDRRIDCRRATLAGLTYIAAVADRVADRIATAQADVADAVGHRADWLAYSLVRLARHLIPAPEPEVPRCAAGCGGASPPKGHGATCVRCRKRQSRSGRAAS